MNTLIGKSLGRYQILEQLGEGGMAVVYKAYDMRLEREVAIKVILPGKEHSEKFLKRFDQEAKALAQLSHPNIVKVIDYGEHESLPYLVMEYLPGGTLKNKLLGKPMPWRDAVRILLPVAHALSAAHTHERKIIHRDVKPSNILLAKSGEPMLTDFGIAKILETEETIDQTGTGVGIGTPEYMAPEQGFSRGVDGRADIYALGVVFYEMVTGRKPYYADTPYAVLLKKATEPLPRPSRFVPNLPGAVERLLIKALAKDARYRYQSMTEMIAALEVLLAGKTSAVDSIPFKWIGAVLGALVVLLVCSGGTYALISRVRTAAEATQLPAVPIPTFETSTPQVSWTDTPAVTPTLVSTWRQGRIAFVARNAGQVYSLYTLNLLQDGAPELLLSPDQPRTSRYYAPWFAPDGSLLAFEDFYTRRVFALNITSASGPRLLGSCSSPTFSPDGKRVICYVAGADSFPIYDVETGSKVESIYHGLSGAVLPAWSPDGGEIAFSTLENGISRVWKVAVDGDAPILLAGNADEEYAPSWSPDGQWIAFQSRLTSEKSEVWIMRNDGTGREQITFSGGGPNWARGPCFSPDGQWVSFVSNQDETDGPDFGDIFIISLLTGEMQQVTDTGGYVLDWRVTWSE